jgi:hypothetical protein
MNLFSFLVVGFGEGDLGCGVDGDLTVLEEHQPVGGLTNSR